MSHRVWIEDVDGAGLQRDVFLGVRKLARHENDLTGLAEIVRVVGFVGNGVDLLDAIRVNIILTADRAAIRKVQQRTFIS